MKIKTITLVWLIILVTTTKVSPQLAVMNVAEEMRQTARYIKMIAMQTSKMVKIPVRIVRLNAMVIDHFKATSEAIQALATANAELGDLKNAIPEVMHDEFVWKDISILTSSLENVGNIIEDNAKFLENTTEEIYDILLTLSTPFITAESATELENIDVQAELLAALKEQEAQRKKDDQRRLINKINEDRKEIAQMKRLVLEKKAQQKRMKLYKTDKFQSMYKKLYVGDSVTFKMGK